MELAFSRYATPDSTVEALVSYKTIAASKPHYDPLSAAKAEMETTRHIAVLLAAAPGLWE